jgi:succinoglycan biosynthesis transport protein ExoP
MENGRPMTDMHEPRLTDLDQPRAFGPQPVPHGNDRNTYAAHDVVVERRHLRESLRILAKRRRLVTSVFLVVVIGVVVHTYTRIPIYEARAKMLIESNEPRYVGFKDVLDPNSTQTDYYQTQYNLLRSRSLARKTLDALHLWDQFGGRPAAIGTATPPPPRGVAARVRAFVVPIRDAVRGASDPQVAPLPSETVSQTRAINALLGGLSISPVRNSRVVDIVYRSADPDLATRVVNAHARSFIDQNMEFKFLSSKEAMDWLAARLTEERQQVEQAETALQRYTEQHDAIAASERDNIVIQKLADMSREVTKAKTTRLEREATYDQLRTMETNRAGLDSFPAILANPVIQQQQAEVARLQRQKLDLSQKMLDTHPDVEAISRAIAAADARLRAEIAKVVQGVRNEYLAALAQERSLGQALEDQKREALSMNKKAIEYGVLAREVESTRQVYQSLLQRAKETGVSTELRTSNVRIVDLAERPGAPIYPQTRDALIMGTLAGLGLALGVGFFFEYLDNRIRTPDEIKLHLHLPALGLLPFVRSDRKAAMFPVSERLSPDFAEALRALRTNVLFSTAESPSRSLIVTSAGPGEGKTVVSSNLAAALADTGLRVLVIDGDLRKPKLHKVFNVAQEPGLSNLIVGTCKASQVVVKTSILNLWVLPAGRVPPNPAELLGSSRFRQFLVSLRDHFDWIVIDTPPVMAVTDASVLAHAVSGVVFVVGAEMVSRQTAATALEQLALAHGKVLGGVLNRVDLDRNAYFYSQYYNKQYREYYRKSSTA